MSNETLFKEYYRIPPSMYEDVKKHIQKMLDIVVIFPSRSPLASEVILVHTKDGKLHF